MSCRDFLLHWQFYYCKTVIGMLLTTDSSLNSRCLYPHEVTHQLPSFWYISYSHWAALTLKKRENTKIAAGYAIYVIVYIKRDIFIVHQCSTVFCFHITEQIFWRDYRLNVDSLCKFKGVNPSSNVCVVLLCLHTVCCMLCSRKCLGLLVKRWQMLRVQEWR